MSDITDKLSAMNQVAMYNKGNVKKLGNIIAVNADGKCMRPLYKIDMKGGQELEVESTHLSHPSQDQMKEATRKESAADIFSS